MRCIVKETRQQREQGVRVDKILKIGMVSNTKWRKGLHKLGVVRNNYESCTCLEKLP